MNAEISVVANENTALAVVEYSETEATLAALCQKHRGVVFDVATTKGDKEARSARQELVKLRTGLDKLRLKLNADDRARIERRNSEADRITAAIVELESPIDKQIKAQEQRDKEAREARIAAEQKRVADLQERVAELRGNQMLTPTSGSALIAAHISDLETIAVDDTFQEYREQAEDTKAKGLERLRELHIAAVAHEAEQKRLADESAAHAAERERLAREKAEQEAAAAKERERIAEENRQAKLKREAEEREHQEQLRRQREEEEAKAAERRRILAEEERAVAERLAAQKAEADRLEAERKAAREAEEARLAEQQAELERQQEALRVQQEAVEKPSDPVEATAEENVGIPSDVMIRENLQPAPAEWLATQGSIISTTTADSTRPTDDEIIEAVAQAFFVPESTAAEWIADMAICRGAA